MLTAVLTSWCLLRPASAAGRRGGRRGDCRARARMALATDAAARQVAATGARVAGARLGGRRLRPWMSEKFSSGARDHFRRRLRRRSAPVCGTGDKRGELAGCAATCGRLKPALAGRRRALRHLLPGHSAAAPPGRDWRRSGRRSGIQQMHHFQVAAHRGAPAHHHADDMVVAARHRTDKIESGRAGIAGLDAVGAVIAADQIVMGGIIRCPCR